MAARLLANLLVMGSGIMVRAFAQAYRQALANASKSGVAHETVQNIRRGSKMVSEPEARQILGITEHSTWEEILQKYDKLFENNAKNGSFYLQSKVHRAKECLEEVYQKKAEGNEMTGIQSRQCLIFYQRGIGKVPWRYLDVELVWDGRSSHAAVVPVISVSWPSLINDLI